MDSSRREVIRRGPHRGMVRDVVLRHTIRQLPAGKALDLGCGDGTNTLMLARHGWSATGLDISEETLAKARTAAEEAGLDVRFIRADMLDWEPDRHYDLVISTYSLPGGAESHKAMKTAIRALRPGGTLIAVDWDHSMAERWGLGPDDLPSPSDLASMVPGLTIEVAESRTIGDLDPPHQHEDVDATIAYLRARKPEASTTER
jgi:SAM-dependent methyltransferase